MDRPLPLRFPFSLLRILLASLTLSVVAASVARAQSLHVVLEPATVLDVGQTFAVHVEARDAGGTPDGTFSPNVVLTLIGAGTLSGTTSRKVDPIDGIARFEDLSLSPAGSYRIAVTGGPATPDTTGTIEVQAGPAAGATSLITAAPTSIPADGSSTSTITVELRDAAGTPLTRGGDVVQLSTTAGSLSTGTDNGDGTYTATLTASATPEDATISGTVNGGAITDTAVVSFTATGPGPASGATSQITAAPTSIPADGTSSSTITVELRDATGTPLTSGGDVVQLSTTAGSLSTGTDNGDGTYTATLTASATPGDATISGTVNGGAITDTAVVSFTATGPGPASGATSLITAAPTSIPADGASSSTITVELRDAAGTPLTSGGDGVQLSTTAGSLGAETDNGDGTYTATLTASATPGDATVSGTVNGGAITDTAVVTFAAVGPGPPSGATSQITASPTSIPASGVSTSTITVELRDASNTPLTTGGHTVELFTTAGMIGTVTDQGNGTYTAPLTSSTVAEDATVTGTVNGDPITDTATVGFTAVAPVATRLVFGQQPTNTQAGATISPAVTVRAVDAGGALDTSFTGNVTIAIGTNPGGGALSGTTTVAAVGGVATFSNLSINQAGVGYTLAASATGLTGATSDAFTITAVTPVATRLVFGQQPTNTPAGATISPAVTVRAVDAGGALDTSFTGNVTIAIGTNPGGGTLSGTTTVAAVGGVATFSNLSISQPGVGYTLAASASALGGATSAAFTITAVTPVATRLVFGQQPTNTPAGATISPAVTVRAVDAGGALDTSFTGNVTIAIGTNSGGGTLSGTTTVAAVGGVATFSNLSISQPGVGYTLAASASGLGGATSAAFTITTVTPVATRLVLGQQPTNTQAGATISPAVTVRAVDAGGALDTSFTGSVTIAIGNNPGGGTLSGTTTVAAVGGVATFSNLSINQAGVGYTLAASASGLTGATSAAFSVTPRPATRLEFGQQPTSTQAGATISPPVTVRAVDAGGTLVTSFTGNVTIAIGTNPGGGALSGTTTVAAVGGVATFSTLSISQPGAGYTLAASATGLTGATSAAFSITTRPATRLEFGQQPTTAQAGATISPAVTVRALDATGALVTSFSGTVAIAIGNNPGGGTLSGTTAVTAVGGVATFPNLSIDRSGSGYTLAAGASGLTGATSAAFNVNPGAPSPATSQITATPTSVPADGASTSTITVELRDAFGNRRVSGGPDVDLFTTAGSMGPVTDLGDGTYTATLTAPTTAAVASITGTVNGAAIADNASVTFTTVPPNTNRLAFVQAPTNAAAGAPISPPIRLRVVNPEGTTVTSFTGEVTIAIAVNPAGGTLSGTTSVVAVAGVATFPDLSIDRAGPGYRLSAGASGITGVTSEPFSITPGAASTATTQITASPIAIAADGASTSTITVEVRDAFGNRRPAGGDAVALTTTAGTLSALTDLGNGTYVATLRSSTTPGAATIRGTLGSVPIVDTATVAFTAVGPPAATRLEFGQQPGNAQVGAAISPPVTVRAVDAGGALVPSFNGTVTIAIGANPGAGTLSGTTTVSAVAGVATFPNLSINAAGTGYTLTASAAGLPGVASAPFTISAPPPPTSTDLSITASVDDATPAVGETVRYTIRVTNEGAAQATGVVVEYELSARLAFVSSVPTKGSYNPQQDEWSVGSLEPGEGATLVIEARVIR